MSKWCIVIVIITLTSYLYASGNSDINLLNQDINKFTRLIELGSRDPQDYFSLGYLYGQKEEYDKAIIYYQKAIELAPTMSGPMINLGRIYLYQKKDYEKALDLFKRAQKVNPGHGKAYHQAGKVYYYMGKQEEASKEFEKAYNLDPNDGAVCYFWADVLSRLGDYDRALELFQKSIDLGLEEKDMAYYHMGVIYDAKHNVDKAIEYYTKSIATNPFPPAYTNLGFVYWERKEFEKAMVQFRNALDYMPHLTNALYGVALIHKELGNKKECQKYLDEAEKYCNPENWEDQEVLEEVYKLRKEISSKSK